MSLLRCAATGHALSRVRSIAPRVQLTNARYESRSTADRAVQPSPKSDSSQSPAPTAGDSAMIRQESPSEAMVRHNQPDYEATVDHGTSSVNLYFPCLGLAPILTHPDQSILAYPEAGDGRQRGRRGTTCRGLVRCSRGPPGQDSPVGLMTHRGDVFQLTGCLAAYIGLQRRRRNRVTGTATIGAWTGTSWAKAIDGRTS